MLKTICVQMHVFLVRPSGITNASCQYLANASKHGAYKDNDNHTRHDNECRIGKRLLVA